MSAAQAAAIGGGGLLPVTQQVVFPWNASTTSWDEVWAQVLAAANGGQPFGIIVILTEESTSTRTAIVSPGSYDFNAIQFQGSYAYDNLSSNPYTVVQFAAGVTLVDSFARGYVQLVGNNIGFEALDTLATGQHVQLWLDTFSQIWGNGANTFANCLSFYATMLNNCALNIADNYGLPAAPLVSFFDTSSSGTVLSLSGLFGSAIYGGAVNPSVAPTIGYSTSPPDASAWSGSVTPPVNPAAPGNNGVLRPVVGTFTSGQLVKADTSASNAVTKWLHTDSVNLIVGIALASGVNGSYASILEKYHGATVSLRLDGVGGGTVNRGTLLDFSTTTDGDVTKGVGGTVAAVVRAQATNTAGASVSATLK